MRRAACRNFRQLSPLSLSSRTVSVSRSLHTICVFFSFSLALKSLYFESLTLPVSLAHEKNRTERTEPYETSRLHFSTTLRAARFLENVEHAGSRKKRMVRERERKRVYGRTKLVCVQFKRLKYTAARLSCRCRVTYHGVRVAVV